LRPKSTYDHPETPLPAIATGAVNDDFARDQVAHRVNAQFVIPEP
jgi:hypothetical protein